MTIKNDEEAITTTVSPLCPTDMKGWSDLDSPMGTVMFNTQKPRGLSGLVNYVRFGIG